MTLKWINSTRLIWSLMVSPSLHHKEKRPTTKVTVSSLSRPSPYLRIKKSKKENGFCSSWASLRMLLFLTLVRRTEKCFWIMLQRIPGQETRTSSSSSATTSYRVLRYQKRTPLRWSTIQISRSSKFSDSNAMIPWFSPSNNQRVPTLVLRGTGIGFITRPNQRLTRSWISTTL